MLNSNKKHRMHWAMILCLAILVLGALTTKLNLQILAVARKTTQQLKNDVADTLAMERLATGKAIESAKWGAQQGDKYIQDHTYEMHRKFLRTDGVIIDLIKKLQDQVGEPWAADYQQMQDATVWITTVEQDPYGEGPASWGSGVFLSTTRVMTAHHVAVNVNLMEQNMVVVYQGQEYRITGVHLDPDSDLATLDTEPIPAKFIPELLERDIRLGDTVVVVGTPMTAELHLRVSQGIVSNTDRGCDDFHGWGVMMGTDATAGPGNSGGPVFVAGRLAALLVGGYGGNIGPVSLIIPVSEFD